MRGGVFRTALAAAALAAAVCVSRAAGADGAKCAVLWDDRSGGFESKFSKSRAENVASLLSQGGVDAPVRPLSEIAAASAGACKVLHLVLPEGASGADSKALDSFASRGGKVVVHGSFSPVVSDFFGLEKRGPEYVKPKNGGAWTGYRLEAGRPLNAPESIDNRTPIATERRAAPARGVSVVARWRSERGESGPAAILRSPAGFWLSRPLYDDGPAARRSELLVALTCALHPPIWRDATPALERAAWNDAAPGSASFQAAAAAVLSAAPRQRKVLVSTLLDAARARYDAAEALCRKGLYGAARTNAAQMASALVRAAAAARPLSPDLKSRPLAVWTASARPPASAGTWEKAASALARAGVTDVMVYAGSLAVSPAAIPGVPSDSAEAQAGNPFADAVKACRAAGLRVHAWFPALRFEGAPQDRFAAYEKSRRLLHSPDGKALPWLDPAVAANRAEIAAAAVSLARRNGLDGVNLDFIRYPDAATREKRSPAAIDSTVRAVREALSAAVPGCKLSASVYGWHPKCLGTVAQDWPKWIDAGLVDFAVPMNYMPSLAELRKLADSQKRRRRKTWCGIGASARESWLSPLQAVEQIRFACRFGYAGAALYAFDDRFLEEFVPVLELAR